ncbi:MAG: fibrobacter succinogenes major paralogous domain-containing protein [Fibromonadaceae bacterium]|jgi:uncharacterized protein (TIGR02145 family)|nr:fibrobacter succinogenes major paralogous domain-containing protein [Fibromonadaceae bacterium]
METKLNSKGKRFFAPTVAAILALAMAFTLNACGGDGGGGDDTPASSSSGNGSPSSSSSGGGSLLPKCGGIEYNSDEKFCDERDEKLYKYVKINGQTWMAENLNHDATGSRCYDDDEGNCAKYGRLYDWDAAVDACPIGWHLPSNEGWDKLYRYADGTSGTESPYDSDNAGRYLKATNGWNDGGNGTDDYSFSALPGGGGDSDGNFFDVGGNGYWWSSSEYFGSYAYARGMFYNYEGAFLNDIDKSNLFSVRCLKD